MYDQRVRAILLVILEAWRFIEEKLLYLQRMTKRTGVSMKSILTTSLFTLIFLAFQACGSIPIQTASHLGDNGDRFGSEAIDKSFDQQSDRTSSIGFSQPSRETAEDRSFDQQNGPDYDIILIPITIQQGFTISYRSLRFCQTLLKAPCSHLRQQAGQKGRTPRAPVSSPGN